MALAYSRPVIYCRGFSRKIIRTLTSTSFTGQALLFLTGLGALATGGVALFIDMPLVPMIVLSAVSLFLLVLFIIACRKRFFPKKTTDASKEDVTQKSPVVTQASTAGVPSSLPASPDMKVLFFRIPQALGNKTDKGDAMILGISIVALGTGYPALFFDGIPLAIMILLLIAAALSAVLVGLSAAFRLAPAKMAGFVTSQKTAGAPAAVCGIEPVNSDNDAAEPAPELPEKPSGGIRDVYWVQAPYTYIRIVRKGKLGFVYTVVEPEITSREKIVLQETYNYLRDIIIFRDVVVFDNPEKPPDEKLSRENICRILQEFDPAIEKGRLPVLYYFLLRDLSGFGLLEPLMHDPFLEDISCNGENLPVYVFHRKYGSLPTSVLFHKGELNQYVLKLAQKANKQISLSNPMVDATLPDGSRVQVTYSDVISTNGSSLTIRKFRAEPMTPLDLIKYGTYSPEILAFLWLVIEHRKSLIIAGGTASGKTSTMNAISLFIPLNSKIVSLEDTREIQLPHKNWLATRTRELSTPGMQGDIDLFALLKSSMRQRPEYIIVGEVRGAEAQTLFQAMNTGHATLSTIHAGSVQEAINRLIHEPINVPPVMFTALDVVVNQSVFTYNNNRVRRCAAIHEISVDNEGNIIPVKLYEWDIGSDRFVRVAAESRVLKDIAFLQNWSMEQLEEELKKREEFLQIATEVQKPDIIDLANAIHDLGE
ncbi:MAG TPA: type II/IV secretion system ATPase subunit [Methanoregula sp.]|nr:type II/IV secretion system ATPase subunit [Methanoregula sp.]